MNIKDKVVLITGSSRGIGRKAAILYAEQGAQVIVTYCKSKEEAEQVFSACNVHAKAYLARLDVGDSSSIQELVEKVKSEYGGLDILINNAGVLTEKLFAEQTPEEIRSQVEVNLLGLMNTICAFLPLLEGQDEAVIINVASRLAKKIVERKAVYAATKHAVRAFTQSLALELPPYIRIYCFNPGLTATGMTNYQGADPLQVAQVLLEAGKETLGKKSGEDIDVDELLARVR
ncbi:MAG TPA: SDR family oxidoreductase [Candidatus Nanoarchaeia archaeon]|nr:SDR family oxidoreductase [Candidatus Nanoarchaeia archaeon]